MNRFLYFFFLCAALTVSSPSASAQAAEPQTSEASANSPAMADVMRDNGKIYVVVSIIIIVLAGLFLYLFLIDKKVQRLEALLQKKEQTK